MRSGGSGPLRRGRLPREPAADGQREERDHTGQRDRRHQRTVKWMAATTTVQEREEEKRATGDHGQHRRCERLERSGDVIQQLERREEVPGWTGYERRVARVRIPRIRHLEEERQARDHQQDDQLNDGVHQHVLRVEGVAHLHRRLLGLPQVRLWRPHG